MSLASVSIVGNLVRDPELFRFDSGRGKASFHVAVNTYDKVKQERSAEYYKVELWDKLADLAMQYLHKGNQITVIGRLSMERWTDREGNARLTPLVSGAQISLPPKPKPPPPVLNPTPQEEKASDDSEENNNLVAKEFGGKIVEGDNEEEEKTPAACMEGEDTSLQKRELEEEESVAVA